MAGAEEKSPAPFMPKTAGGGNFMINYEMFKELVTSNFLSYMPNAFKSYDVKVEPCNKTNQTLDGLCLVPPDHKAGMVSPVIYINQMYEQYFDGDSFEEVMEFSANKLTDAFQNIPDNLKNFSISYAEEKVVMMLVNTEQNKEMLKNVPHREFNDLSIVYRYVADMEKGNMETVLVDKGLAKSFGMSEQQLYEAATINTKKLFPPIVKTVNEVICEMFIKDGMPEELADMMGKSLPPDFNMYMITNDRMINGAVSMLYEEKLHELAEKLGNDLYILPSSIHEVLAVSAEMNDPETLAQMVFDINMDQVELEERLSNQVYYYDKDLRKISLATDTPNKRLDSIVAEPPMIYETAKSR